MDALQLVIHTPSGEVLHWELALGEYTVGSGEAVQIQLPFEGVAERHVALSVLENRFQVDSLVDGVRVNGHPVDQRVEVGFPGSVEFAGVTLILEVKLPQPGFKKPESWKDIQITLPPKETKAIPPVSFPQSVDPNALTIVDPSFAAKKSGAAASPGLSGKTTASNRLPTAEVATEDEAPLQGAYKLVKEIARGGMGKIFFGDDPQLEREVAVKVSSLAYGGVDPRFSREAKVLARLAHPNIVPIYAMGVDSQGRPYYSMKLVKGRTLQAILNALSKKDLEVAREYPLPALLTIFRKVCDAMAFAHSKRILHRDLKPENIMVGEYGEVLVMDWGLAKTLGSGEIEREESLGSFHSSASTDSMGMTMEGDVMGTPQYMSPEQAEGWVADLDERSDIYSLGGMLYALLTLRPPIGGKTLEEVLTKVKSGQIDSMITLRGGKEAVTVEGVGAMECLVPEALQAVTLKAMALDRDRRYSSVEAFSADLEAYQNGFATQAEEAGFWKRAKLWVRRNKVVAGSVAVLAFVVSGFTAQVIQKGREASKALQSLRETAPTFAIRARDALQDGQFEEALKAASFAVQLEAKLGDYHELRGNALQVLGRWEEALEAYRKAVHLGQQGRAQENLELTEKLIDEAKSQNLVKARAILFEALNEQGRQYEAMAFGKELGDFWRDRKKDLSVVAELVKSLEVKMIPVPGTDVLMSKTECTVGEWKLYLRAEGLPDWQQPSPQIFLQTDDHPVVKVSWNQVKMFCDWLSRITGKEWRLPTYAEWDAAVGKTKYPWGEHYPPHWDDGNYAILDDGKDDPERVGVDGIKGTAPVGSFRPNLLGFYDLGGNVWEWLWDFDSNARARLRGSSWGVLRGWSALPSCDFRQKEGSRDDGGFRLVRRS